MKNLYFSLSLNILKAEIVFLLGHSLKSVQSYINRLGELVLSEIPKDVNDGCTIPCKNGSSIIWLPTSPSNIEHLSILQHEIVHAAIYLLEDKGIPINSTNDEILAYVIDYITEQIYIKLGVTVSG